MPSRQTARKRIIRELLESAFAGKPVLLDELRWAVFVAQPTGGDVCERTITRSWLNSFAQQTAQVVNVLLLRGNDRTKLRVFGFQKLLSGGAEFHVALTQPMPHERLPVQAKQRNVKRNVKNLEGFPLNVGGWIDHAHLLVRISAKTAVSDFVGRLKASSIKHVNETSGLVYKFGWQDGFGAFSVSASQKGSVARYIRRQKEHHSQESFEDKYVRLLEKHEIHCHPRYLWD